MLDDNLDSLIDQALPSYGNEPSASLEAKIIAAANARQTLVRKNTPTRWIGIASTIAAAGLVALMLIRSYGDSGTVPDQRSVADRGFPIAPASLAAVHQPKTIRSLQVPSKPHRFRSMKAGNVDSSAPLTDQEEVLLDLATNHPAEARQLVSLNGEEAKPLRVEPLALQPIPTEPLKFAALKIEPLP